MIAHEQIVDLLCRATHDVFSTMLSLEIRPGEARTETNPPGPTDGVVSFIGVAGSWVGTGSLSCTPEFACKVSSHLLTGEPPLTGAAVDEEVLDAFAEVTNMIIGNFKTSLEDILGPLGLSIPTVVFGRNFMARTVGNEEWTVVPFFSGEERMDVRVCLVPKSQPHHSAKPSVAE